MFPVVTISPRSVNVSYNSTVIITCEVQSLTTPNVTWMSDTDVTLPSTSLVSNNDVHISNLTLELVTLEYIGEYTCTAENEGGEMSDMINVTVYSKNMCVSIHLSSIYLSVYLYVSSLIIILLSLFLSLVSLPVVIISPGSVNVSYNSTVTLTCEVQSLTIPNVIWMSNTDVILPPPSLVSNDDIHTSVLTLEQVTLEYIGEYTCTAENEGGEMSDIIRVDVYGKDMCDIMFMYLPHFVSVSAMPIFCLFGDVFILSFIFLTSFYHPLFLPFFKLFLSLVPPPELQTIPDQTVTQGLNVTFTCIATVGFSLSYLWTIPHLNCVDCGPVALNVPTITLTDITNQAQGLYTCIVTDFVNQIATTSSMLTVAGTYLILNRSAAWTNCTFKKYLF